MTAYTDQAFIYSLKDNAFITKVVGVSHQPNYPRWVEIMMQWHISHPSERLAGVLVRDPDNLHDVNTIEVHVPVLESRAGFIPTKLAAIIAPKLDDGWRSLVQVWSVLNLVNPEYPGVRARVRLVSPP